jgi:hypothetical protein
MRLNDALPVIEVDPETYEVRANGELLICAPATELPLARATSVLTGLDLSACATPVAVGQAVRTSLLPKGSMAVITNDICTREDAGYLMRAQVLSADRIRGVETGGCPHTAIREDAAIIWRRRSARNWQT